MKWVTACLVILTLAACTDSTKVPNDIIQKDKMEKIMWDMLQADRYVNTYIMTKNDSITDKKKNAAAYYQRVFNLHGITRDQFIKSYKFYLSRPDITKVMFDSISAKADRRRGEVHMPRKNTIMQKRDSLMRLDSIRKQDSIDKIEMEQTTEKLTDSALREEMFKHNDSYE